MVKAVYLAGNSYPNDRHLEDRVITLLATRLGIDTIPQSRLIPQDHPLSLCPLEPTVRARTLYAVIEALNEPTILIGRSSGARTITKFAHSHPDSVVACICFAYPFQAVGQPPEDWRTKHLQTLATPTLIIQGTRDRFGHSELSTRFALDPHTEVLFVDADHESRYNDEDWKRIGSKIEELVIKTAAQRIEKRCVFYISGFDPRGAGHSHSLFSSEVNKKNAAGAMHSHEGACRIKVSKPTALSSHTTTWRTEHSSNHTSRQIPLTTHTDFQFLGWDDIARAHWPVSRLKHWLRYLQVSGRFLWSGFLPRAWQTAKPAAIQLLAQNLIILVTLLALSLIAFTALRSISAIEPLGWSVLLIASAGVLSGWAVWRLVHAFEHSQKLNWMMRSHAFIARQAHDEAPEIEQRIDSFAQQIIERTQQNIDEEILLVGHSSGAILVISALARALAQCPTLFRHKAKIALLTIEQCTPMLSLLPRATRFRYELATLAQHQNLLWIDLYSTSAQIYAPKAGQFEIYSNAVSMQPECVTTCSVRVPFDTPSVAFDNYLKISTGALPLHKRFESHIPILLPDGFEASVYFKLNPDVALSGMTAEDHYRLHGKRERRVYRMALPKDFDAQTYLTLNPDVARAGVAADMHYIVYGLKECRPYRHA